MKSKPFLSREERIAIAQEYLRMNCPHSAMGVLRGTL